ncbi:unnamed protein product [Schistosoma guineensis]|nr:unnamed protein product [Schistosoma guineensis]
MLMKIKNVFQSVIFFSFMSFHKIIVIFGIINTFVLLWLLYKYDVYNNWTITTQVNNDDILNNTKLLTFNQVTNLHVYIVEEHHEVIPYWFDAAKSFNNKKAVLLHIDAHSDMDYPELVDEFPIGHFPHSTNEMKTLMQANDEFIQSAIITNLIQTVYIIYPYWTSNTSYAYTSSLGITTINNTKQICMCLNINTTDNNTDNDVDNIDDEEEDHCKTRNQVNPLNDFILSSNQCPKTWLYHYIELNSLTASNILRYSNYWSLNKLLNLNLINHSKPMTFDHQGNQPNPPPPPPHHHHHHRRHDEYLPLILDIDEDFFGVHLVTHNLLKSGLNINFIHTMNSIISLIFCPIHYINEIHIDQIYRWLLEYIYINIHLRNNYKSIIDHNQLMMILKKINKTLQITDIFCYNYTLYLMKLNELFINNTITYHQIDVLKYVGVCFTNSLITYQYIPEIHLCLGHNLPNQSLVDEFLPISNDLLKLAIHFTQILLTIPYQPNIITIARSSRDGYTPRWLQYDIELMIINILKKVFHLTEKNIIYTNHLAGDKYYGWYHRFT